VVRSGRATDLIAPQTLFLVLRAVNGDHSNGGKLDARKPQSASRLETSYTLEIRLLWNYQKKSQNGMQLRTFRSFT
jgi:hypothetical protein